MKRILTEGGGMILRQKNYPRSLFYGGHSSSLYRHSVRIFNIQDPYKIFIYQILLTLYKQYFVNLAAYKR